MALPQPKPRSTIAQYLDAEEAATVKHEFHDGEILPMSGGSPAHSLLAANAIRGIGNRLKGKPCRVYTSDLRVAILDAARFVYPDATIVCGGLEFHPDDARRHTVTNPRVIIEALSPFTEAYDRGDKFRQYQKIPSLQEFVLISPYEPRIETFTRLTDGAWQYTAYSGPDATAKLRSVDVDLPLAEVYAEVEYTPKPPPPDDRS